MMISAYYNYRWFRMRIKGKYIDWNVKKGKGQMINRKKGRSNYCLNYSFKSQTYCYNPNKILHLARNETGEGGGGATAPAFHRNATEKWALLHIFPLPILFLITKLFPTSAFRSKQKLHQEGKKLWIRYMYTLTYTLTLSGESSWMAWPTWGRTSIWNFPLTQYDNWHLYTSRAR